MRCFTQDERSAIPTPPPFRMKPDRVDLEGYLVRTKSRGWDAQVSRHPRWIRSLHTHPPPPHVVGAVGLFILRPGKHMAMWVSEIGHSRARFVLYARASGLGITL